MTKQKPKRNKKYNPLKGMNMVNPPNSDNANIWSVPVVQALVSNLEGLVNGTKKLVIKSKAKPQGGLIDYEHTFVVEDSNNGK